MLTQAASNDLFAAIDRGRSNDVARLIASGADLSARNSAGDTPLLYSIRTKRHKLVPLLLTAGADSSQGRPLSKVERRDFGKTIKFQTPLSLATLMSDVKCIDMLLAAGAAIDRGCEAAACMNLVFGGTRAKATVVRLLNAGLNPKCSWKGVRLYRLAEQYKEIREKLEALGERLKPRREVVSDETLITRKAAKFGVSSFVDFVDYWGHPTWAVLAIEAPLESTIASYSAVASTVRLWSDVPIRLHQPSDNGMAHLVSVVRPKASNWTLIYRCVCLPFENFEKITADGQSISSKLKTRALCFSGHDTSGAMGYTLYKNGKKIDEHGWEYRTDPSDKEFAKLELFVPACFPRQKGSETCLVVMPSAEGRVARADIVEIVDF